MEENNKCGFTIIEIVLALAVCAAIFSAVLPLLYNATTSNRNTKLRLLAYEAASREIESLREQKVASLVSPSNIPFVVTNIPGAVGNIYIIKALGDEKIAAVTSSVDWIFKGKAERVEINAYLYGSTE